MTLKEFGTMLNNFMDIVEWTNYGNEYILILGRDIGVFIIGYMTHLIVSGFIEVFFGGKKNDKKQPNQKKK